MGKDFKKRGKILEYHKKNPNVSIRQMSRDLGFDRMLITDVIKQEDKSKLTKLQNVISPKLVRDMHYDGNAIITADHHCPCVDLTMVDLVIETAKSYNIKRLFDIGDFFNLDALSSYARKIGGDGRLPTITEELEMGLGILKMYAEWFDEIYMFKGNHEMRFEKIMNNKLSFGIVLESFRIKALKIIDATHFYIGRWRVTHPKSYSQIGLAVASRLHDKFLSPIINSHGHRMGIGYGRAGEEAPIADIGCMADPDRVQYINLSGDTTHPKWIRGFYVYHEERLIPYCPGFLIPYGNSEDAA